MSEPAAPKAAVTRRRPASAPARLAEQGAARTPPPPANMNSIGQTLRARREEMGQVIETIAETLKIRRMYLQAIEESDWKALPELVYAQGFVRSYADHLGMDGPAFALQFKKEFRGGPRTPELDMPKPIEDNQTPSMKIIFASLGGLVLILLVWSIAKPARKVEPTLPAPSSQAIVAPTAAPVTSEPSAPPTQMAAAQIATAPISSTAIAPAPAAAPALPQNGTGYGAATQTRVTITAAQDSWVQVRASDGQVVFSRVMRPGDYYRVPPDVGLTLTTGNLSGLNFNVDGHSISPNSTPGTVQRNLPLAPDGLASGLAKFSNTPESRAAESNVTE